MFTQGQRFRVRRDYRYLNHTFHAGEEVLFTTCAYSPKEGITRYWRAPHKLVHLV